MRRIVGAFLSITTIAIVGIGRVSSAAPNTEFQQVISAGVLSTDILDASQAPVANPSVVLTPLNVSTVCQTATGTYGTNTQRIYVDNPGASDTGWVLSLAATSGSSAEWDSGTDQYDFNSSAGSGCTNGQLAVNPSVATTMAQNPATLTGVSLGSQAAFNQGATDSIELVNAGTTSDDIWRGYLTDIGVSQTIPASIPAGTYTIDLTQTVVSQ